MRKSVTAGTTRPVLLGLARYREPALTAPRALVSVSPYPVPGLERLKVPLIDHVLHPAAPGGHRQAPLGTQAGRLHMGRHVALVLVQPPPQALAVHQPVVVATRQHLGSQLPDIVLVGFLHEHPAVQFLLKIPGQPGPVGAYVLQALEHQAVTLLAGDDPRIALLAALVGTAHGGHQEALEVGLEFQLQHALQPILVAHRGAPPAIQVGL